MERGDFVVQNMDTKNGETWDVVGTLHVVLSSLIFSIV